MEQPGLHGRHRDKNGAISRKHGNTLVSTLRKVYGTSFALGFDEHAKLSAVLETLDDVSLSQVAKDHETGRLEARILDEQPRSAKPDA